ncbi:MAG: tetratricopeptide repeat protein [Clostridiales bacterium]|nr:tetratricopeptide repeat protein [Clostridiales bacterium]
MPNIICLTQNEIEVPYKFKLTDINVYSFEEALYHFYHYWKQSTEDFLSDDFILWVKRDLNQEYIASKISSLRMSDKFSDKYLKFVTIIDYFSEQELYALKNDLEDWEKRMVWEQLKAQADSLVNIGEYIKAANIYLSAIKLNPNADIYNNLGIAYNKTGDYKNAYRVLMEAYQLDPGNQTIIFNLAEASILRGNFDNAEIMLSKVSGQENKYYLLGLFYMEKNGLELARDYFLKAYNLNKDDFYLYKIIDICLSQKHYDDAAKNLNQVKNKNQDFYLKQSEICFMKNNVKEGIKTLSGAVEKYPSDIELWAALAKYYRLDNDFESASIAIEKARSINPNSIRAEFEHANIKKSQGKIKDFQSALHNILEFLKKIYRANNDF